MYKLFRASLVSVAPLFALFAAPVVAGELPPGLYAQFDTDKGVVIVELFYKDTPMTVANFVGLAEGKLDTSAKKGEPFYDGLIFHRVIGDFMIQGGDPTGTGMGDPGYRFADEFRSHLRHDSPGILSMANSGPGTNGSQFFITHVPTPHLDDRHTVFGKVVQGQDVVNKIQKNDKMKSVRILRVGPDAEQFMIDQAVFDKLQLDNESAAANAEKEKLKKEKAAAAKFAKQIKKYDKEAKTTKSGLKYVVLKDGEGAKPRPGQVVAAEYTGRLMDGRLFDTSVGRGPFEFAVGKKQVIAGWDEALGDMKVGEKRAIIVPANLAYGKNGVGDGLIPPNSTLFFEVERLK